jgi:ATPase subunit of ABC transporter with duplicated ATPase domains
LEACVWLEEHLSHYKKCLLVVSHSQDFLNTVCNKIVWLHQKDLKYYSGGAVQVCEWSYTTNNELNAAGPQLESAWLVSTLEPIK